MFSSKKPYTSVTVTIERLTSEDFEEDDLGGIPDLVDVIKLQATGPTEAARAIRKKLKYGNVHRQLRALVLLDGLIQNAGSQFRHTFADEPLLERLRVAGTSGLSDPTVRRKCRELFANWAKYKDTPGMEQVARLHKDLPRRKVAPTQEKSKVIKETENPFGDDDEDRASEASSHKSQVPYGQTTTTINSFSSSPGSSHKKTSSGGGFFSSSSRDKRKNKAAEAAADADSGAGAGSGSGGTASTSKRRPFNLEAEKDNMKVAIADSSIATTNLMNALQSINREKERISENKVAVGLFETCKQLRRRIFRYIHYVEDEQWLGSLLNANDQLVLALMTFEQLDRSIDADSDSEDELAEQAHQYRMASLKRKETGASSSSGPGSPRSASSPPPPSERFGLSVGKSPPPRPSVSLKPLALGESVPRLPPRPRPSAPGNSKDGDETSSSEDGEDDDENDPFADRNAVSTPMVDGGEWV